MANEANVEAWLQAAQSGPFVAQFVLIAFLCASFIGCLVWVVKHVTEALDKIVGTLARMDTRIEPLEKVPEILSAINVRLEHLEARQ